MQRRARTSPTVTIVIPARNEARNLKVVLAELPEVHEVLLVDGHSVDDTVGTARQIRPDIRVVRQTRIGKGNALACGFLAASGDIVVMFDADGSADPAEIPAFVDALVDGADFAKGSRFCPGGGSDDITALRRMGNSALCSLANALFRTHYSDLCYGFNAFWRDVVPMLHLPCVETPGDMVWGDGFEIETVLNCRAAVVGLRITEVPSVERCRRFGTSQLDPVRDGSRVLYALLAERLRAEEHRHRCRADQRCFLPPRTDLLLGGA